MGGSRGKPRAPRPDRKRAGIETVPYSPRATKLVRSQEDRDRRVHRIRDAIDLEGLAEARGVYAVLRHQFHAYPKKGFRKMHAHDCYEYYIVDHGPVTVKFPRRKFKLRSHGSILIPPHQFHEMKWERYAAAHVTHFRPAWPGAWRAKLGRACGYSVSLTDFTFSHWALTRVVDGLRLKNPVIRARFVYAMLHSLIANLSIPEAPQPGFPKDPRMARVADIMRIVQEMALNKLDNIKNVVKMAQDPPPTRKEREDFHRHCRMPIATYVRLKKARYLLEYSRFLPDKVAQMSDYSSYSTLITSWKRFFPGTPGRFRDECWRRNPPPEEPAAPAAPPARPAPRT